MGVPQARSLLDVACGTGKHLEHLGDEFDCEGLDLNPEFVKLAQQRTGVRVHSASMDAFDIEERFDAVVCLFSSIGYTSDLPGAIGSMARHLNPDGVLIIEPWLRPDQSVGNVSTRHWTALAEGAQPTAEVMPDGDDASHARERAVSCGHVARTPAEDAEIVSDVNTMTSENEWALRDSNPRPQPCEGCALTS